jgi:hypothetical protein
MNPDFTITTGDITNRDGLIAVGKDITQYQARNLTVNVPDARRNQRVYIGSMGEDLDEYGRAVKNVLINKDAYLPPASAAPAAADEEYRASMRQATGYIGLLGYWCGSVRPGADKSTPHCEFLCAQDRWQSQQQPPIKMYVPDGGSAAAEELRKRAESLMAAEPTKRQQCDTYYQAFRSAVMGYGLGPVYFQDRQELREYIAQVVDQWRVPLLDVATGRAEVREREDMSIETMEEWFGSLGRKRHLDATKEVFAAAKSDPDAPAFALLVHGDRDAGLRIFLDHLLTREQFLSGRRAKRGRRPPLGQYDQQQLTQWIGQELGFQADTPAALAELVHGELQKQQLVFAVDPIDGLIGGLATFYDAFWLPFYSRLKELRARQRAPFRLVAVICTITSQLDQAVLDRCTESFDDPASDFAKLYKIPPLGPFTRRDLISWLEDLKVPDAPPGRRAELIKRVLTNDDGQMVGAPALVYERLRGEDFWLEVQNDE